MINIIKVHSYKRQRSSSDSAGGIEMVDCDVYSSGHLTVNSLKSGFLSNLLHFTSSSSRSSGPSRPCKESVLSSLILT